MSVKLPNELQSLKNEFAMMKKEASALFTKVNESNFNKRPDSGGWSAAECIDHLIVTGIDYCDKYEEALKIIMSKDLKLNGEIKYSWFAERFIRFVAPPVRFRVKSPKRWKPDSKINKSKVTAAYLQLQDRYMDLIDASEGWDISKIKLPSPATKMIKFSAFEILGINSAHQRRHFLQAKKVLNIK